MVSYEKKYEKKYNKYKNKIIHRCRSDELKKKILLERIKNFDIDTRTDIESNDINQTIDLKENGVNIIYDVSGTTNTKHASFDNIKCCIENIGSGSFGSVSIGIDVNTGKTIVIKKIKINKRDLRKISIPSETEFENLNKTLLKTKKNKIIEKIEKEIKIMMSLNHDNIIKIIGYDEINDDTTASSSSSSEIEKGIKGKIIRIYMEDVCGKPITKLSREINGFSLNIIKLYSKQILEGLKYLHSQNIVHYDIKGYNVLLSNTGLIKIIDFGEAEKYDVSPFILPYKGTKMYMAPEITSRNNDKIEKKNLGKPDIWSFGVMLVEMFVGTLYIPNETDIFFANLFIKNLIAKNELKKMNDDIITETKYNSVDINDFLMELSFNETETNNSFSLFMDFIGCCLEIDYEKRFTTEKLLNHPFLNAKSNSSIFYSSLMNME